MQLSKSLLAVFLLMVMSGAAIAANMDTAGVKVDDGAMVAATKVNLNGAGIYYRGPFKVYVAELYATKSINSLEELIAADGPKRVKMTFVRDVDPALMSKIMTRGIEDNASKSQFSKIIPGLKRMSDIFTANKTILVGDITLLDWIPGTGLVITIKGKTQGEPVKEPEFFNALMAVWLGPNPTYWKLKDEMLGIK